MKDPYMVLGVAPQAADGEIKAAYRRLAKKYHPDVVKEDVKLTEKMYEIQAAYEVIGDSEKRKKYDIGVQKANQKNGRKQNGSMEPEVNPDMSQFERFFGFQAGKGMETYRDKRQEAKPAEGPIDPEELFARYFGKRKQ